VLFDKLSYNKFNNYNDKVYKLRLAKVTFLLVRLLQLAEVNFLFLPKLTSLLVYVDNDVLFSLFVVTLTVTVNNCSVCA